MDYIRHDEPRVFLFEESGCFYMSPAVHRVLLNSAEIIENALLPIVQLSEEAAEATNKYFRRFRLFLLVKVTEKTL